MDSLTNAKRIYENVSILLRTGQFAGGQAGAIAEAQAFIDNMIIQINATAPDPASEPKAPTE